jgi:hypothetical protein
LSIAAPSRHGPVLSGLAPILGGVDFHLLIDELRGCLCKANNAFFFEVIS